MRYVERQGLSPKLKAVRKARAALAEVIVWERARDYAAQHNGGLENGLLEHIYQGLWSDYERKVGYRDLIAALAEVRLIDAAAARPDMAVQ